MIKFIETESRRMVARGCKKGEWEVVEWVQTTSFAGSKEFWRLVIKQ